MFQAATNKTRKRDQYIFLYSTVRCSNILKSKHDCIKTIYEKYCTKPQSIAKIVLKNGMSKEFLFLFQKKFNRYEEKVMIL